MIIPGIWRMRSWSDPLPSLLGWGACKRAKPERDRVSSCEKRVSKVKTGGD